MSHTISLSKPITTTLSLLPHFTKPTSSFPQLKLWKNPHQKKTTLLVVLCKSSEKEEEERVVKKEEEWLKKLPEKNKALYAHSLMCIEGWLSQLGFRQRTDDDPAAWLVENRHWHAYLNLDVTDLSIRYLKTGPGNLEKDVERRFSYALSREDIENAILGGP